MDLSEPVTAETVSSALQSLGLKVPPQQIALQQRHGRWVARLPDDALVVVADNSAAVARLAPEAKLLELLRLRVSFGLPRIHYADSNLQVRIPVRGSQIGGEDREQAFAATPQATRLADDLGRALAELHHALTEEEAEEIGPAYIDVLPEGAVLRARLEDKLPDPITAKVLDRVLDLYGDGQLRAQDIALVHGDLWGGNMAVDPETGTLLGLFDFDDSGLADRHVDFMYFHSFGDDFACRALAAYTATSGRDASWERIATYHAVAAFAALADIRGKGEDHMLQRRRDWVRMVCHGPIGTTLLGVKP